METTDDKKKSRYSVKPMARPKAVRKNFLVEKDVAEKMERLARILTGGNQTELLHKAIREMKVPADYLDKVVGG